jgi:zinc transport system substrate-binding protein
LAFEFGGYAMTSKTIKILLASCIILIFLVSGCGQQKAAAPSKQGDKKLTIVTSFYPMYIEVLNITKDVQGVQVVNMTQPQTGCLHDYQLKPDDLKTLETASVFVINGAGMEQFMDKIIKHQPKLKVIEASKGIALLKDEEGENPHVWVSISNAMQQTTNIAEELAAIDPANAAKYKSNAANYKDRLSALREKMHQALDNLPSKEIITFHEAFPYFAQEFNLKIAAVIEREPGAEPTPKEMEETIEKIKTANIKALFAEPQYPLKAAEAIARETGAKVYTLNPAVTGEAKPEAIDDYLKIMEQNLSVLKEALQ